ncbi:MAG TPA: zinc-ribbon domain-containing protein, partial [Myxococcaceae bacterium]|nr:zinc-ribbon domain-containing protein [Myxococcaceae bacterium]
MIVKCDQCQTRFKIPDEKVTEKGVKVRCTKCQHTFRVARAPEAASAPVSFDPFADLEAPPAAKPPPPVTAHVDPFASLEGAPKPPPAAAALDSFDGLGDPSENLTQRATRPPGITGPRPAVRETTVSDDLSDLLGPMDP